MNVLFNLPSIPQYLAIFQMCKSLAGKLDSLTIVTNEMGQQDINNLPANLRLLEIPKSKPRFLEGQLSKAGYASQDIIHDTFGYLLPLGALAKLSNSKKYITSVWGSSAGWYHMAKEIELDDEDELNLSHNMMLREHVNSLFCDAILVNSPSFSKDYVKYFRFPNSKIYEIPEPVIINQEIQYSSKLDGPFNILYVGQISQMKGIHVLLEAFEKLLDDGHDAKLTAIGKFIPHDRNIIEQSTWKNVKFLDPVGHNELAKHFQKADLYVHPSYQEGMPRVVMEALSYGVPVVASDLPGIRTMDRNGTLIKFMENFDSDNLKDILCNEIVRSRKDFDYFQNARARMEEFSPEKIADKIFNIYEIL